MIISISLKNIHIPVWIIRIKLIKVLAILQLVLYARIYIVTYRKITNHIVLYRKIFIKYPI
ncbi:hypothetical protein HMPREF2749_05420 [Rothia sp. HMSC075F09]|nr:hypothetical protein HMPREF2749_05420 [Rothia sp. HMSC075F09]